MSRWYTANARNGVGEIAIFNEIGRGALTASDFHSSLKAFGNVSRLDILISSDGGDVSHGIAIFNMLAAHKARKVVTISGLAASMASVIAMAGDEIRMPENSMMMVHEPWGGMLGRADEIENFAGALRKMGDAIEEIYSKRTGQPREKIAELMDAETWMDAEEAVSLGFADKVIEPVQMAAKLDSPIARRAPAALLAKVNAATNAAKGRSQSSTFSDDIHTRIWDRFNRA